MSIKKSHRMIHTPRNIGQRIKKTRKSNGLSQKEFSENIGISPNYLSDLELDKKPPSKPILLAIEYRYATNVQWLLTGEGNIYKTPEGKPPEEPRPGPLDVKEPQPEYADRDEPAPAITADYPLAKKLTVEIEDAARLGLTEEELIDILAKILEVEQIKRRRRPRPATEPIPEPPVVEPAPQPLPDTTPLDIIRRIAKEEVPPEGETERRKCMAYITRLLKESDDIKGDISPETP